MLHFFGLLIFGCLLPPKGADLKLLFNGLTCNPCKTLGESVCECVCLHECVCSLVLLVIWSPAGTQSVSGCACCVALHGDTIPDLNLAFQKNIMDFLERRTLFGVPAPATQHELVEGIWTHGWLW